MRTEGWTRNDRIAALSMVLAGAALVASFFVPEVRRIFGLNSVDSQSPASIVNIDAPASPQPLRGSLVTTAATEPKLVETSSGSTPPTEPDASGAASVRPCIEYMKGRENVVVCNSHTQSGYYWRLTQKLAHYSVEGVYAAGSEPRCGEAHVGRRAMTARFPIEDFTFRVVMERYINKVAPLTAPRCDYVGNGIKVTDQDFGPICGIFEVTCTGQGR